MERRAYPRYKCPDLVAMARDPAASLDYYFKVADISLDGLALVTSDPSGYPFTADSVLDIQVFCPSGVLTCRGVVARVIMDFHGTPLGFGVRLYSFSDGDQDRWIRLVEETCKRDQP